MRGWRQDYRDDSGRIERLCPHGIGHPDPDDPDAPWPHTCDGCCDPPTSFAARRDFPGLGPGRDVDVAPAAEALKRTRSMRAEEPEAR